MLITGPGLNDGFALNAPGPTVCAVFVWRIHKSQFVYLFMSSSTCVAQCGRVCFFLFWDSVAFVVFQVSI